VQHLLCSFGAPLLPVAPDLFTDQQQRCAPLEGASACCARYRYAYHYPFVQGTFGKPLLRMAFLKTGGYIERRHRAET
jgi:hypothetical protein